MHILITGASGSGTTTLGAKLAAYLDAAHIDGDDYYWLPTDPPYTKKRPAAERLKDILAEMRRHACIVISGSVTGWGDELENKFDLIVFLYLDTEIRVKRLRLREQSELGYVDEAFIEWASQYDQILFEGRSLKKHRAWLETRKCPVVELNGDKSVADRVNMVNDYLSEMYPGKV